MWKRVGANAFSANAKYTQRHILKTPAQSINNISFTVEIRNLGPGKK